MSAKTRLKCLLAATTMLLLPSGAAAQIVVEGSNADFNTPTGQPAAEFTLQNLDSRPGNERASLGQANPTSNLISFASAASQAVTVGTTFSLGDLSYFNGSTTIGTNVTSINLDIVTPLTLNGVPANAGPFSYTVGLELTPNAEPCPFPSVTPCSDRLSLSQGVQTSSFTFNGQQLSLFVDGFRLSNGAVLNNLVIDEGNSVTGQLIGRFAVAVPEPSTWAMMLAGFGLVGGAMRRARRLTSVAFA